MKIDRQIDMCKRNVYRHFLIEGFICESSSKKEIHVFCGLIESEGLDDSILGGP